MVMLYSLPEGNQIIYVVFCMNIMKRGWPPIFNLSRQETPNSGGGKGGETSGGDDDDDDTQMRE